METNLPGQIRQTKLPKSKPTLPLFEAVMNAYQAIQEAEQGSDHSIIIRCEREDALLKDGRFINFEILDTGIGLNKQNFDSFNTAYSEHKLNLGGKGIGRFLWLVAFERVVIRSAFKTSDAQSGLMKREFIFDTNYSRDNAQAEPCEKGGPGTCVRLEGLRDRYKSQHPRSIDALASDLMEHFVLLLLKKDCPRIEIHDESQRIHVNELFEEFCQKNHKEIDISIQNEKFTLHSLKLDSNKALKHRLIFAASSRAVKIENLEKHIPNLSSKLSSKDEKSFFYLGVVQGSYLDEHVNSIRTEFDIDSSNEEEEDLFIEKISLSQLKEICIEEIRKTLGEHIEALNESKLQKIKQYVRTAAPQYKPLLRDITKFIDGIPPNAPDTDMELELHKELHKREIELKKESKKILEAAKIEN